jgi:hypothetical protein
LVSNPGVFVKVTMTMTRRASTIVRTIGRSSPVFPAAVGHAHEPFVDPFLVDFGDDGTGDLDGQCDVTVHDPPAYHFP